MTKEEEVEISTSAAGASTPETPAEKPSVQVTPILSSDEKTEKPPTGNEKKEESGSSGVTITKITNGGDDESSSSSSEDAEKKTKIREMFLKSNNDDEADEEMSPVVVTAAKKSPLAGRSDVDQVMKYLDESNPCHKLRSLCKKGDLAELTKFLSQDKPDNLDVDYLSEEGWSCLHEIITHECQFIQVARILVEHGADVNTQDVHGDSPLHSTLLYHNMENVKLLLKNGADLSLMNLGGRRPIHVADDVETLQVLLDEGDDVNCTDAMGNTPLHFAVVSKDINRVKLLLSREDIDVNIKNSSGSVALHLTNGDYDIASLLLEKSADVNIPDVNENTPLHLAVRGRHKEIVRAMIEHGGNPNLKNSNKKTPLNLAKDKEMKNIICNNNSGNATPSSSVTPSSKQKVNSKLPVPVVIDKDLVPDSPKTPGILKRKREISEEENFVRKGPRLTFSPVVDYSGVDKVEINKRVKVPPIYSEPQFSSDED